MNFANALGFVGFGITMWLLPHLAPGWFPHTAIDGSSTRALWVQMMGFVQCTLGLGFALHHATYPLISWARNYARTRRPASAPAWEPSAARTETTVAFENAAAIALPARASAAIANPLPEFDGSVTLHGEYASLWRALNGALPQGEELARLTARVNAVVRGHGPNPHPLATAVFRHSPRHSFVHLVDRSEFDGSWEQLRTQADETRAIDMVLEQLSRHTPERHPDFDAEPVRRAA